MHKCQAEQLCVTTGLRKSYYDIINFYNKELSIMDCSNKKGKQLPCRVQMQIPPCMDTNCSSRAGAEPPRSLSQGTAIYMRRDSAMPQTANYMGSSGMQQPQTANYMGSSGMMQPQGCCGAMMPSDSWDEMRGPQISGGFQIGQMPIGMAYVPWQQWCQTYPMEQGFRQGTIFPELDLTFMMGRCRG